MTAERGRGLALRLATLALAGGVLAACSGVEVREPEQSAPSPSTAASDEPSETPTEEPSVEPVTATAVAEAIPDAGVTPARRLGDGAKPLLVALPRLAHQGDEPAPARRSSTVLTAQFGAEHRGRTVELQQRVGKEWAPAASTDLDRRGRASFTAAGPRGRPARFRVVTADDAPVARTGAVDTESWGDPVFADEFSGGQLDQSKWIYRQLDLYNPEGSRACSRASTDAVEVSGGTLQLSVLPDRSRAGETCRYTDSTGKSYDLDYYLNGHVATEGIYAFTHGVAAARIKFPRGQGQHGAFWLQRTTGAQIPGDPASSGTEIDVVEYFGDGRSDGGLASFLYFLNKDNEQEKVGGVWPQATRQLAEGDDWWKSYHVFSVEWTPESYIFRVDGRMIFETSKGVSGVPQFPILSQLTSDWELPKLERGSLPSTMDVDWVRVWQR